MNTSDVGLKNYQDPRGWLEECYKCGSFDHSTDNCPEDEPEEISPEMFELNLYKEKLEVMVKKHAKGHRL